MLEVQRLSKTFSVHGRSVVGVADVDLMLEEGSFTALVGRSGCGKTTLLRILAGLISPSSGSVRFRGEQKPTIGCVFQEPRLMPWLTVARNVAFGLVGRLPPREVAQRVSGALELVGLEPFRDAYPDQLSGGMASRVGLARALAMRPKLLLLDEPFAALDAFTRRSLQQELVEIWAATRPTIVFVTHDVEEAVILAERVIQMHAGRAVAEFPIALSYPREPTDFAVSELRRQVLKSLSDPTGNTVDTNENLKPESMKEKTA